MNQWFECDGNYGLAIEWKLVFGAVYDEEALVVQLQNELAKLEVDILHTQGHNLRLEQAMQLLNDDINEKMQTIGKYEVRPSWLAQQ